MGKETEGQKYKRLSAEYDKLFQDPNRDSNLISEYREITNHMLLVFSGRNLEGIELEKAGKVNEAIALYEKNVKEEFFGGHPYERLAIIYKRRGLFDDELRIIRKSKGKLNEEKIRRRLEKLKRRGIKI